MAHKKTLTYLCQSFKWNQIKQSLNINKMMFKKELVFILD
ncbi:MAG: hypothetical protein ACI94Y_002412 [Maribacter sp.]|jgi:hypothetical protein